MAGPDAPRNEALVFKEQGNKCFQAGDYIGAESFYTKAINKDPKNHLFYTNRAMASLKLDPPKYTQIAADCRVSIELEADNFKGWYYLSQAQIELKMEAKALESAREAHRICVEECRRVPMGKGASNIERITELVLRCKKEWWEEREREREVLRGGLLVELCGMVEGEKREEMRRVFERAEVGGKEARRRKVPDWIIDDITFSVMLDPVVTKTGQSYDRSSIMEHLKRSPTDPLTREPLRVEDLRPNLALKEACEQFLAENGWAVDW